MILVVIGPNTKRFAKAVENTVANGSSVLTWCWSSNTPLSPEGPTPKAVLSPGYVNARITDKAICIENATTNLVDLSAEEGAIANISFQQNGWDFLMKRSKN
ncbi:MAG: hypothetical protein M1816_000224 [Peltula sp. TS41687]|nr:MAG: hypothetical protein M1816_000224 [Peltula sp. TS41687]